MNAPSWIEIDLGRLEHNVRVLRRRTAAGCRLCAVVKKNAYGLGALPIAHRLARAGVDMLAVFDPAEARELVAGAITEPILIMAPVTTLDRTDVLYRHAVAGKLHLAVHSPDQARALAQVGHTFGLRLPVHLHLDTGMARMGLARDQFNQLAAELADHRFLKIAGVMTHMATGDTDPDFLAQQMDRFDQALTDHASRLPAEVIRHVANTTTVFGGDRYHADMIRPGLGLLGHAPPPEVFPPEVTSPEVTPRGVTPPGVTRARPAAEVFPTRPASPPPDPGEVFPRATEPIFHSLARDVAPVPGEALKPIARWLTTVTHVQGYERGTTVGYHQACVLDRHTVVGVVPVGYGDGYPVALSGKGVVRLIPEDPAQAPIDCPVLGKVSMDQLTVDLSAVPRDPQRPLSDLLGATVELYGHDPAAPNAVATLAAQTHTHAYEVLCRLSGSVKRIYAR